jgi:hypothetical protein
MYSIGTVRVHCSGQAKEIHPQFHSFTEFSQLVLEKIFLKIFSVYLLFFFFFTLLSPLAEGIHLNKFSPTEYGSGLSTAGACPDTHIILTPVIEF